MQLQIKILLFSLVFFMSNIAFAKYIGITNGFSYPIEINYRPLYHDNRNSDFKKIGTLAPNEVRYIDIQIDTNEKLCMIIMVLLCIL
jgi:hypothetical protein